MQRHEHLLKRLDRLAWLMDASIRLPGGFRIGLDGLIGLIPGVGDSVGLVISLYLLFSARQIKAPMSVYIRMLGNIALEFFIGLIPLLGDLFDFYFKANLRNMEILRKHVESQA